MVRKTNEVIRDNFVESMEDAVEVIKNTQNRDEKLMALGAGMLMATKCAEWILLPGDAQEYWDTTFAELLEAVRNE